MNDNTCYHCGDAVLRPYVHDNKSFCCTGCMNAYRIISKNDMEFVYRDGNYLSRPEKDESDAYRFLQNKEIAESLYVYQDREVAHVRLTLPSIHCSSCVWLLENLFKINSDVGKVEVDMMRREARIVFNHNALSLYDLALLLARIGYPPSFTRNNHEKANNASFYMKLGVAGFCFGNIMLFSFPEYLSFDQEYVRDFRDFFSILILALSIPVLVFSAKDYLKSAFMALKSRLLTLDVSIALGITALYSKSVFDIINGNGPGYMDSFAAFVFLLLVGKWFQNYTYDHLSFDNKLETYFPMVVMADRGAGLDMIKLDEVESGDVLILKDTDVIPVDGIALESATIDYSFVTGESEEIHVKKDDAIYVGGKIVGRPFRYRTNKQIDKDRLRDIWKADSTKKHNPIEKSIRVFSAYFLKTVLLTALLSATLWMFIDADKALFVGISVLIVACPCALALSLPFTVGNASRLLARSKFYVKDPTQIPILGKITAVVFDKTGTITVKSDQNGRDLDLPEPLISEVYSAAALSGHPKSVAIKELLEAYDPALKVVDHFDQVIGKGTETRIGDHTIRIGTRQFALYDDAENDFTTTVSINRKMLFSYEPQSMVRPDLETTIKQISESHPVFLLSGDSTRDKNLMHSIGIPPENTHFNQLPEQKQAFIADLKKQGYTVLMIGDGLNDIGALNESDFGIAVSDNIYGFIPQCDAILESEALAKVDNFIRVGKRASKVLKLCFGISVMYNLIGLYFAITGQLSPLIAAVLMPISSVSIVLITRLLMRR